MKKVTNKSILALATLLCLGSVSQPAHAMLNPSEKHTFAAAAATAVGMAVYWYWNSSDKETMTTKTVTYNDESWEFTIPENSTVKTLKETIAREQNIPINELVLTYVNGINVATDELTMENIHGDLELQRHEYRKDGDILIEITPNEGPVMPIFIELTATVKDLKLKIEEKYNKNIYLQKLYFNRTELNNNDATLNDVGLTTLLNTISLIRSAENVGG